MKNFISVLPIWFFIMFFLQGCEKWRDNRNPQTALDNALAESSFHDIFRIVLAESREYEGLPSDADSCSSRSAVATNGGYPISLSVSYGNSNCSSNYRMQRKGTLVVSLNQPFSQPNAQASLTLQHFEVNGYKVEGNIVIMHKGVIDNKTQYRLQVSDGKITSKDGRIVSWACDRVFETAAGQESPGFVWDDVFNVSGTSSGVNYEGRSFTSTINKPLVFKMTCRWITEGEIEFSVEQLKDIIVNYGDGNCDNDAEAKIGKRTYNMKLK
jgi:hypothetical protein